MPDTLNQPLTLPCGAVLPNRIAKAAMTEGLATLQGVPTEALQQLYGLWSDGGAGLLLSGNIIIDANHLERPGNVVIDCEPDDVMNHALISWTKAATRNGNHFWAQINHAGRQTQKIINPSPKAPSAVKLAIPGGQFGQPIALTKDEIQQIIQQFVICAKACQQTGFTGIQIHSAHGYLLSEFLSPRSNLRIDKYGGSLENRARLLLEIVRNIRKAVGAKFPIAVKLNSADFQKGGFAFEDSLQVVVWLEQASVDLIEISGGTYEQPKLLGLEGIEAVEEQNVAHSTALREAYFVDFAKAMQDKISIPLMVTGGFRSKEVMELAIKNRAADVIGIARPMCVQTDAPKQLLAGTKTLPRYESTLAFFPPWLSIINNIKLFRTIGSFGVQYWYYAQLDALGKTGKPDDKITPFQATRQLMKQQKEFVKNRGEQIKPSYLCPGDTV